MKRILFGLTCACVLAATSAEESPSQLALTIYNDDLALVQDVRRMAVGAGRTKLEFKDVSAQIRPETVTLAGAGLEVLEQNFDFDLLTPAKMMEKAVGREVQIVRTNPGNGQETTETATVLSTNNGVVVKIGDRIEVLRQDGAPTHFRSGAGQLACPADAVHRCAVRDCKYARSHVALPHQRALVEGGLCRSL